MGAGLRVGCGRPYPHHSLHNLMCVQCLSWSAWDWRWPPLQVSAPPAWVLGKPSQLLAQISHLPGEREAFPGSHRP